jgi:beta-lactamase superfamily II metal-dependent hydrolase
MYRQGHGDCFLLAFRRADGAPFYMLIDCGMKRGSGFDNQIDMQTVAQHIRDSTGGHLHLVAITHEHEDHVSGFRSARDIFGSLTIDRLWLAWTENPEDRLANDLREKYHDTLLGLAAAANRLQGVNAASSQRVRRIVESLLGFEVSDPALALAAHDTKKIEGITNKEAILVVKKRADRRQGTDYLLPYMKPQELAEVPGVRVFVLGPPHDEDKLKQMDPTGDEQFALAARAAEEQAFLAAVQSREGESKAQPPFDPHYRVARADIASQTAAGSKLERFFRDHYDTPAWRRIDGDWLHASEQFALRMNDYVNNTSLVLAIELPRTKKVLLFVGDAQRGNWTSWNDDGWTSRNGLARGETVAVADLLRRTVFYKVGHHGSENATLNAGGLRDMAQDEFCDQFVAMIPAHEEWALSANNPPWQHPYEPILKALCQKARHRILRMDQLVPQQRPRDCALSASEWARFLDNTVQDDLFLEFTVPD